jgi:hypothetical protein
MTLLPVSKARPEMGPIPVEPIKVESPVNGERILNWEGPPDEKITVP